MRFPVILFAAGLFAVSCGNPEAESVTAPDSAGEARVGEATAGDTVVTGTATPTRDETAPTEDSAMSFTVGSTFQPYQEGATGVVYDTSLVPQGASAEIDVESSGDRTVSRLRAKGFLPNRTYGAHLHTNPCGADPKDAGPHFQHTHMPGASPHVAANPVNEVWLDFTTDQDGAADSRARQPWGLTTDRMPGSLVIHAEPTKKSGPKAGDAGARVACITLQQ